MFTLFDVLILDAQTLVFVYIHGKYTMKQQYYSL